VNTTEIGCICVMTTPYSAVARRDDAAVVEVEGGVLDVGPVAAHNRLVLRHQGALRVDLLAGDRVLCHQLFIAGKIDAGGREHRFIACELALGLVERRLIGARVDLRQEVADLDALALGEPDLGELAADLRLDDDGRQRRDRAERLERYRHVTTRHLAETDDGGLLIEAPLGWRRRGAREHPPQRRRDYSRREQGDGDAASA
jgi:hypothetical protein